MAPNTEYSIELHMLSMSNLLDIFIFISSLKFYSTLKCSLVMWNITIKMISSYLERSNVQINWDLYYYHLKRSAKPKVKVCWEDQCNSPDGAECTELVQHSSIKRKCLPENVIIQHLSDTSVQMWIERCWINALTDVLIKFHPLVDLNTT